LQILVDTSVWIDFFRKISSRETELFKQALGRREQIFITGIIAQEILQGIRQDSQHDSVLNYLLLFSRIEDEFDDYLAAAKIYRTLRRRGVTVRSPVDCLIASLAMKAQVSLLHNDSDFTAIARQFPLSLI
jgi:predicted nucleic acid-binding protein